MENQNVVLTRLVQTKNGNQATNTAITVTPHLQISGDVTQLSDALVKNLQLVLQQLLIRL